MACRPESPLIEQAFQAIAAFETQFSPVVIVANEEVGLTRWLNPAYERAVPSNQAVVFNGDEFSQAVNHAHTIDSIDDFRQRLDQYALVVLEYPPHFAESSQPFRELIGLLDRSREREQLVVVLLSEPVRHSSRMASALASRLSGGLQVNVQTPPRRLKDEWLRHQLEPWWESATPRLIEQALEFPVSYWTHWEECVFRLRQHLVENSEWPNRIQEVLEASESADDGLDPKHVAQQVAKTCQLKWSDLRGSSRRQSIVRARSIAIYLVRELTGQSFEGIGKLFGNRDHSTVIHAYRKITSQRHQDVDLENSLHAICHALRVAVPSESMSPSQSA